MFYNVSEKQKNHFSTNFSLLKYVKDFHCNV